MSSTFADLGVSEAVAGALAKRGIETPFAVQSMVVPDVLDGHDVLVKSPTGSGKTLAFGVPLADRLDPDGAWPSALILAPTRELAAQIVDELAGVMHARALKITAVYGGVGIHNQAKQAGRSHVLVATPGRLLDLIERRAVRLDEIDVLILDEADRMLDMGFKPVVDRIVDMTPRDRQTLLFSATLEGEVGRIAAAYTQRRRAATSTPPAPEKVGHIEHRFHRVAHEAKVSALVHELGDPKRGLTLVFVRTKRGADRLVKRLGAHERRGRRDARRQVAVPAREGARPLRGGQGRHARRDRRRRARDRRHRRHPRHQLRRARRARGLRPPRSAAPPARARAASASRSCSTTRRATSRSSPSELGLEHGLGVAAPRRAAAAALARPPRGRSGAARRRHRGGARPPAAPHALGFRATCSVDVERVTLALTGRSRAPFNARRSVGPVAEPPDSGRRARRSPPAPPRRSLAAPTASAARLLGGFGSTTRTVRPRGPAAPPARAPAPARGSGRARAASSSGRGRRARAAGRARARRRAARRRGPGPPSPSRA